VHYPADPRLARNAVLVLAHGAGAGERHPFMTAFGRGLAAAGIDVVTFNFLYMEQRRKVPDTMPVLEEAFRAAIERAREDGVLASKRLFIGGKSMGGRVATHLAAAHDVEGLHGVIALGYPLHPPGRPDQPRTSHLPAIRVPVLIVQGERDAFGTPAELEPVVATMQARVTLHVVTGGDHSLKVRGTASETVYAHVIDAITRWMQTLR